MQKLTAVIAVPSVLHSWNNCILPKVNDIVESAKIDPNVYNGTNKITVDNKNESLFLGFLKEGLLIFL